MAQKKVVVDLNDYDALDNLSDDDLHDLVLKVSAERDRLKEGLRLIHQVLDSRAVEEEVGETISPNGIESEESVHDQ